jgi:hypothetical protein
VSSGTILSIVAALVVAIPSAVLSLDKVLAHPVGQSLIYLIETIAAMFLMWLPILKARKQTILDAVLGRMVINESDFNEEAWSSLAVNKITKQRKSKWKIASSILYWLAVIAVELIWVFCLLASASFQYFWFVALVPIIPPVLLHVAGERKWKWIRMGSTIVSLLALCCAFAWSCCYHTI